MNHRPSPGPSAAQTMQQPVARDLAEQSPAASPPVAGYIPMPEETYAPLRAAGVAEAQDRVWGNRPIADRLFRAGTDPHDGRTLVPRDSLAVGLAAALLLELSLLADRSKAVPKPLLTAFQRDDDSPALSVHRIDRFPGSALQHKVWEQVAKAEKELRDQRDPLTRVPVADMIDQLAVTAYETVGVRLADAGVLVEDVRRAGLLRRETTVWRAYDAQRDGVVPATAVPGTRNAWELLCPGNKIARREELSLEDRLTLGLFCAVGLDDVMREESGRYGLQIPDLQLFPEQYIVIDAAHGRVKSRVRTRR